MDSYPCPTDIIATFHSLSDSGAAIGGYPSIVLMISGHMFFFNKKMVCNSSISAFIASTLNSIMKSAIFFFPCLKVSIFHSASTAFALSLNVILISLTKSSQSWVPVSLSSLSSFLYTYMPATPPLRHARIAIILSSVSMTLSLLRNSLIPLYQSSNFVWLPSNHPGSGTIFFGIPTLIYSCCLLLVLVLVLLTFLYPFVCSCLRLLL